MIEWTKCSNNPISHAVYRGFIVHKWVGFYCFYYSETPNTPTHRFVKGLEKITLDNYPSASSHSPCDLDPYTNGVAYAYCQTCLPQQLDKTIDFLLGYKQDLKEEHMERLDKEDYRSERAATR